MSDGWPATKVHSWSISVAMNQARSTGQEVAAVGRADTSGTGEPLHRDAAPPLPHRDEAVVGCGGGAGEHLDERLGRELVQCPGRCLEAHLLGQGWHESVARLVPVAELGDARVLGQGPPPDRLADRRSPAVEHLTYRREAGRHERAHRATPPVPRVQLLVDLAFQQSG